MNKLDEVIWANFKLEDIVDIASGVRLTKADQIPGKRPFIGSTDSNNGITGWVSNTNASLDKNVLGVNYNGSVVENFYHPYEAIFSDDVKRIKIRSADIEPNKYMHLFLKTVILQQKVKYMYSYKFNAERMSQQILTLPATHEGKPDWSFMGSYMRQIESRQLKEATFHFKKKLASLAEGDQNHVPEWKEVHLEEVFDFIQRGRRLIKSNQKKGDIPYISSTAIKNGVDNFISNDSGVRKFQDGITIANSGSVGAVFYQAYPFIASDHVTVLRNEKATPHAYLFIVTALSKLGEKYAFNREMSDKRIRREKIILPVDSSGAPNWKYMDAYMKSQEAKRILQWLKSK